MHRLFSSRYLLFGLALSAVWLLGRGRAVDHAGAVAESDGFAPVGSVVTEDVAVDEIRVACSSMPLVACDVGSGTEDQCEADALDSVATGEDELTNAPGEFQTAMDLEALQYGASIETPVAEELVAVSIAELEAPVELDVPTELAAIAEVDSTSDYSDASSGLSDTARSGNWTVNPYANQPVVDGQSDADPKRISEASHTDGSILENFGTLVDQPGSAVGLASDEELDRIVPAVMEPVQAQLSESAAQGAAHHIEYGKSLSRRGAVFAARQEFYAALAMVAHNYDLQMGGTDRSTALRRGVQAIREAGDFLAEDAENQIGMNVRHVVETHTTQIISDREAENMVPVEAMQRYFSFAQQQLVYSGGQNAVSAEALFCLGKLHSTMAMHQPERLDVAKAIVYHRASLENDPNNYRSANELGVLLARSGQLEQSRDLLKRSLTIQPATRAWQNLAKVHQRLGEQRLAQLAASESVIAANQDLSAGNSTAIRWLPAGDFNALAPASFHDSAVSSANRVLPASSTEEVDDDSEKKTFAEKLKSWF